MRIRRTHERGAAMVEGALVLVVFITLCLAVVDFGQFLFVNQAITERVRWAARQGAVGRLSDAEMVNMVVFGQKSPPPAGAKGAYGLTPGNIEAHTIDKKELGRRVELSVRNLKYPGFTPLIAPRRNLQIRVVVPLETP
jgi:hypothetical protein